MPTYLPAEDSTVRTGPDAATTKIKASHFSFEKRFTTAQPSSTFPTSSRAAAVHSEDGKLLVLTLDSSATAATTTDTTSTTSTTLSGTTAGLLLKPQVVALSSTNGSVQWQATLDMPLPPGGCVGSTMA